MSNADIKILVTNDLAQRILDAIDFPLEIVVPDDPSEPVGNVPAGTGTEIVAGAITVIGHEVPTDADPSEEYAIENAILLRGLQQNADGDDIEITGALREEADISAVDDGDGPAVSKKTGRIKNALSRRFRKFMSVQLIAMKLEIARPEFALGEQILFMNVEVAIQIKFRVCVSYFGKKSCKTFQTERIQLQARQLRLDLQTAGAKICVLPSFIDLDVVLKYSMFGVPFTTRPGIASIVNAQLRKKGPLELLDLTSFERSIPFSSGKLTVSSFTLASGPKGLAIDVGMTIT